MNKIAGLLILISSLGISCDKKTETKAGSIAELDFEVIAYLNAIIPPSLPKLGVKNNNNWIINIYSRNGESYYLGIEAENFKDDNMGSMSTARNLDLFAYQDTAYMCCDYSTGVYEEGLDILYAKYGDKKVLRMSSVDDYLNDEPESNRRGWLSTYCHELAHVTENYNSPDSLLNMFELFEYFESDSVKKKAIVLENKKLLATIQFIESKDMDNAKVSINEYFEQRDIRTKRDGTELLRTEAYLEFVEGYGRFVEYLAKSNYEQFKDSQWKNEASLPAYDMLNEKWMYDASFGNAYFYCTGFNKIRILDLLDDYAFSASIKGESDELLDVYLARAFLMD